MHQCHHCESFIPPQIQQCPNCAQPEQQHNKAKFGLKRGMQFLMGASVMMTLAACYGAPPPMPNTDCPATFDGTEQPCKNESPAANDETSENESEN